MKISRHGLEIGIATWIFLVANAVFGIEALVNTGKNDIFSEPQERKASACASLYLPVRVVISCTVLSYQSGMCSDSRVCPGSRSGTVKFRSGRPGDR